MTLRDPSDPRPIHFMGIAGAGMSALAELFVRRGVAITGCDSDAAGAARARSAGLAVEAGHDPGHVERVRAVVVTSAVRKDHPELVRARGLGLPIVRRAEALAEAVTGGELVAIAGTHGKTSTTVLTTEALASAGLAPTGLAGARVSQWGGNILGGDERVFVVEADEFDRSFLALRPTIAVVTNMEADHLDTYSGLDDIRAAFAEFVGRARAVVLCADDEGASSIPLPATAEIVRYGITSPHARLVATGLRESAAGSVFDVVYDGALLGAVELRMAGRHSVLNALAAIGSGLALGAKVEQMRAGLARCAGADRRFQAVGEARGITVIDDYAHHPTEIRATVQAARASFPGARLVVAFQPHLFSRTRDFADEFAEALSAVDALFLADIYPSREKPIPGVTSAVISEPLRRKGRNPAWEGPREGMAGALAAAARPGDVVITVGAGDVTLTARELLDLLNARQ
ncbi:MAG: UDP-N-acetylmuramate--L-alanine ligase [Gemmatimonadaceae bacterium]